MTGGCKGVWGKGAVQRQVARVNGVIASQVSFSIWESEMNRKPNAELSDRDVDFSPSIAQTILDQMQQPGRRDLARAVSGASWMMFAAALDQAVVTNPGLERSLGEVAARSVRTALAVRDLPVPSLDEFLDSLRTRVVECSGTVVRAFWWGFHLQISHRDLSNPDPVGAIQSTSTAASPFLARAAGFVASALHTLRSLDRGDGVYISMSWFAPFIFVPTSV